MGNNKSALGINEETASFDYHAMAQQDSSAAEMGGGSDVPLRTGPPIDVNMNIYGLISKAPQMADDVHRLANAVEVLRDLLIIAMVASLLLCLIAICLWACCYGRRRSNKKVFYDVNVSNSKRGIGGGATPSTTPNYLEALD